MCACVHDCVLVHDERRLGMVWVTSQNTMCAQEMKDLHPIEPIIQEYRHISKQLSLLQII